MKTDWEEYYKQTSDIEKETPLFLKEAVKLCPSHTAALDLGAGALSDTRFLINADFDEVIAIDTSETFLSKVKNLNSPTLKAYMTSFYNYEYPYNYFDVINAQYALPFNEPETFELVLKRVFDSLKPGGVFTGQLFGVHDSWSRNKEMSFVSRKEVCTLMETMDTVKIVESEYDGKDAAGNDKHWHIFNFLIKKPL